MVAQNAWEHWGEGGWYSNVKTKKTIKKEGSLRRAGGAALSEEAVEPREPPVLAGESGLDVLIRGQICQVTQGSHCWLLMQHLSHHPLDIRGFHLTCRQKKGRAVTTAL